MAGPGDWTKDGLEALTRPTRDDIVIAAGWFEGEGTCHYGGYTTHAAISQSSEPMLIALQALFGGTISEREGAVTQWQITGPRARGFLMTIYPFLLPRRRKQVREALNIDS